MFSKPFIASLEGHADGIYVVAKPMSSLHNTASTAPATTPLTSFLSGDGAGEIRLWNLSTQKTVWKAKPFSSFVQGLAFVPSDLSRLVCVGEKTIHLYNTNADGLASGLASGPAPIASFLSNHLFTGLDHHRFDRMFATSSSLIQIWDHSRSEPISTMEWGSETITTVKFNQTETSVLASCGSDRSIVLYDIRTNKPVSKVFMKLKTNAISWNPMEAFNFSTASEDHNCYTFDMRSLSQSLSVAKGHVSAVMDLDYSPTGKEFVTASYDKTIRIFGAREGRARDVYHTKRMQKAFSVKFSMDDKYILSASDDGNVRIWKSRAAEKLGVLSNREIATTRYNEALTERYASMPEISRIKSHKRLPKAITKASARKSIMVQAIKTKESNRRKHSKPGAVPFIAERKKGILAVEK